MEGTITKRKKSAVYNDSIITERKKPLLKKIWERKWLYVMLIPLILYLLIFCYYPMHGILLAFKDFSYSKPIILSPWTSHYGFGHFIKMFNNPMFGNAFKNTIIISIGRIIFQFPFPILLALLLNEVRSDKFKRVVQTVYTFPHFISWIIVTGLFFNLFSNDGVFTQLQTLLGFEQKSILGSADTFVPLLFISYNWKEVGWSAIIYLASISGINPELYEAAKIDGAGRFQLARYITLPCLKGTIAILFVLAVAGIMNAGFDQIFNMGNPAVQNATDIIDTLVYRMSFAGGSDFGYTTAIGLFKSIINFGLLLSANILVKRTTGKGIY